MSIPSGSVAGGMRSTREERIPILWPERLERTGFIETLTMMGIRGGIPGWKQIEQESEILRRQIETGEMSWPPSDGLYRILLDGMGREPPPLGDLSPHSFPFFMGLPSILRVAETLLAMSQGAPPWLQQQTIATTLHEIYHLSRWRHFGRRVYVIERDTFELLANSDLPDMPAEYLVAPLPHFYVRFPDGVFHFDVAGDPVPQPAEGVMVGFHPAEPSPGKKREVSFLITGRSPNDPADDNVAFVAALVRPDAPVSQFALPDAAHAVEKFGQKELSETVPRAVIALCLYLQSEHPVLEPVPARPRKDPALYSGKKRRRIKKENERTSALGYIRVGRVVEDVKGVTRDATGRWKLDHQVWVRGHWRWQAHGPKHQLRKLIFIRPYMKGPDLAESLTIRAAKVQPARRREKR